MVQSIGVGAIPVVGSLLQSLPRLASQIPTPALDVISRFGYHPEALAQTAAMGAGYGLSMLLERPIVGAIYRGYEDRTLKASSVAVETPEKWGHRLNAWSKIGMMTSMGFYAGVGMELLSEDYASSPYKLGILAAFGAGHVVLHVLTAGVGTFLNGSEPALSAAARFDQQVRFKTQGWTGRTWNLEQFLERDSVSREQQGILLKDAALHSTLRSEAAKRPAELALFMNKALMRAASPEMDADYRVTLLRLIAVYVGAAGMNAQTRGLLTDARLAKLLVDAPNKVKTAAHGVYVETLSEAKGTNEFTLAIGKALSEFYWNHAEDKNGLAKFLPELPPVALALFASDVPLTREDLMARVDRGVKNGAAMGPALAAAFKGPHMRVYRDYVDESCEALNRVKADKAGAKEALEIAFLRELFSGLNAGSEQIGPRAVLKASLPFIVAANDHVRHEALRLQEEQTKNALEGEKKNVHAALVKVLKSDSLDGLMKQPARIKIEVLQHMGRMAGLFQGANDRADYDYTVSYLFDNDADVRKATAKMHFDLLEANKATPAEEAVYLKALLAHLRRISKTGEPDERAQTRLERVVAAVNAVYPALSDEGKKQVVTALGAIDWGFTSELYEDLARSLDPETMSRLMFDKEERVKAARTALAKFVSATPPDFSGEDSLSEAEGEKITKSLLDITARDIIEYVQEKFSDAADTARVHPVATAAVAGGAVIVGTGVTAFALHKFLQYARSEQGRTKIGGYRGGVRVLEFIDKYMPANGNPATWTRDAVLRLPFGPQILGLIGSLAPKSVSEWLRPDLVAAAQAAVVVEQVVQSLTPTSAQVAAAFDQVVAEDDAAVALLPAPSKPEGEPVVAGATDSPEAAVAVTPVGVAEAIKKDPPPPAEAVVTGDEGAAEAASNDDNSVVVADQAVS